MQKPLSNEILSAAWIEISKYTSPRNFFDVTQLAGVPPRSHRDRLGRLTGSSAARRLLSRLEQCDDGELRQLQALAEVNAEQAQAAFRRAFVVNISGPFAVVVAFGQLAPTLFAEVVQSMTTPSLTSALIVLFSALIPLSIGYTYLRATDARDLHDLVRLFAAAKGA